MTRMYRCASPSDWTPPLLSRNDVFSLALFQEIRTQFLVNYANHITTDKRPQTLCFHHADALFSPFSKNTLARQLVHTIL